MKLKITINFNDHRQFILWNELLDTLKATPLPKHLRISILPGGFTWKDHTNSNEIFNGIASLFNNKRFQSLNSLFLDLNRLNNAVDLNVDSIKNLFDSFQYAPVNGYFKLGLSNNNFNREAVLHITDALKKGKRPHNMHLKFENNGIDNFGFISFLDACISANSPDNWSVELGELNGHISAEIIADYINATNESEYLFRKGAVNFKITPHQGNSFKEEQEDHYLFHENTPSVDENENSALIPYFKQPDKEKYTLSANHLTQLKEKMQLFEYYPSVNYADSDVQLFTGTTSLMGYHHLNHLNSRPIEIYLIYCLLLLKITHPYHNDCPSMLETIMAYLIFEPASSCMKGIGDIMYIKRDLEHMNEIPRFSSELFKATNQLLKQPDSWVAQWATNNRLTP